MWQQWLYLLFDPTMKLISHPRVISESREGAIAQEICEYSFDSFHQLLDGAKKSFKIRI
jgi:hypothetical protein